MAVIKRKIKTCNRLYYCANCKKPIKLGEKYNLLKIMNYKKFFYEKLHLKCKETKIKRPFFGFKIKNTINLRKNREKWKARKLK